jgi:hypothetical protein
MGWTIEKEREAKKNWRDAHPTYNKQYREDHKERLKKQAHQNYLAHREEKIRKTVKYHRAKVQELRAQILAKYGKKCNHCGLTDERVLCVDHVNGGGYRERMSCSYEAMYKRVLADTNNTYQILCHNCNWIKRCERRENIGATP